VLHNGALPLSFANGINNCGQVVGTYRPGTESNRGFVWNGEAFQTLPVPGEHQAWDINDAGRIVGDYDSSGRKGFLLSGGQLVAFAHPSGSLGTILTGINNRDAVVGAFVDQSVGFQTTHGFIATLNTDPSLGTETNWWAATAMAAAPVNIIKGQALTTAVDGSCFVTGFYYGEAIVGAITLTNSGSGDVFLTKYGSNGESLWVRRAGGRGYDEARSVAADAQGNCYISGIFEDKIRFEGVELRSVSAADYFLAKYSPNGTLLWATNSNGSGTKGAWGVSVDGAGNCYVVGGFPSPGLFHGISVPNAGDTDLFLAKYGPGANLIWVRSFGGTNIDYGRAVTVGTAGAIYVAGGFTGDASFSTTNLVAVGDQDAFVAKLADNGSRSNG
jgi:hypothetical protein